jgi:hypothetical protein
MSSWNILLDNPLITKHLRSRLRPAAFYPLLVVVALLCLVIVGGATFAELNYQYSQIMGGPRPAGRAAMPAPFLIATVLLTVLQGIALLLGGTSEAASAVANAKEKGILDFHRISPQPLSWLALGFLLGAPIREYLLALAVTPFLLVSALLCKVGFVGFLLILLVQTSTALVCHSMGMVIGLSAKKARGSAAWAVSVVLGVYYLGSGMAGGGVWVPVLFTSGPVLLELFAPEAQLPSPPAFFGIDLPLWLMTLLYQVPLVLFFFLASMRKLRADSARVFSKPLAVGFLLGVTVLTLGSIWEARLPFKEAVTLYVVAGVALALSGSVAPFQSEYLNGLRRAAKHGQERLPPWSEGAANPVVLGWLCVIVLLAGTAGWWLDTRTWAPRTTWSPFTQPEPASQPWLPILTALAWVVSFGCGAQYFNLRFGKRGTAYFRLYLFLTWAMPLLVSMVALVARSDPAFFLLFSLSPLTGLGITCLSVRATLPSAGMGLGADLLTLGQMLAAALNVVLAVLFSWLLVSLLRDAARALHRIKVALPDMPEGAVDLAVKSARPGVPAAPEGAVYRGDGIALSTEGTPEARPPAPAEAGRAEEIQPGE